MNAAEKESCRKGLVDFLKCQTGKSVKVCGMWTGDFIGVVTNVGFTQVSFRVEKPTGDAIKAGDTVTFPYGHYLKVVEI